MGPVVDQMDFALSSPHIHTQHSAVVSVSWLSHLHTSYQVIACQTHQPEPKPVVLMILNGLIMMLI